MDAVKKFLTEVKAPAWVVALVGLVAVVGLPLYEKHFGKDECVCEETTVEEAPVEEPKAEEPKEEPKKEEAPKPGPKKAAVKQSKRSIAKIIREADAELAVK